MLSFFLFINASKPRYAINFCFANKNNNFFPDKTQIIIFTLKFKYNK